MAGAAPDAILSIYNQAVAYQCRADAPVAGCSIDRRALHTFSHACEADGIEALICFCCGRTYAHLADIPPEQQDIQWLQPLEEDPHHAGRFTFLGQPAPDIANLLGLDTYLRRYDNGQRRLTSFETFDEWCVHLPMHAEDTDPKKLLCNPEDSLVNVFLPCKWVCKFVCKCPVRSGLYNNRSPQKKNNMRCFESCTYKQ